jgi:hypothetical protein
MWNEKNRGVRVFVFLALVLFGAMGCSGDDPAAPVLSEGDSLDVPMDENKALWQSALRSLGPSVTTDARGFSLGATNLPFPDSPEQVMANFRTIYETMDVREYLNLMHPDFLTILQQSTTEEFPDVGTTLDRYEEQNIHKRMFSGRAVTDPDGNLVPGILNVSFNVLMPLDVWQLSPGDDIIPNALWAPYEVNFLFDRGQNFSTIRIEGMIKFYVTGQEFEFKGVSRVFYQMVGQVDLTGNIRATEDVNWGSLKALYR